MKIERVRIGKRSQYYADGEKINPDALSAVLKGIYGRDVCAKVFWEVTRTGSATVERYIGDVNENLIAQLETANKKIAALEKTSNGTGNRKHLPDCLKGDEQNDN